MALELGYGLSDVGTVWAGHGDKVVSDPIAAKGSAWR
jgi:hypothetical protein